MSYTFPNGIPQGSPKNPSSFLREALIGEIVAINDYSHHITICPISEVTKTLTHIMEEEKNHYGQLFELIRKSDDIQMEKYLHVMEHHRNRRRKDKHTRYSQDTEKLHMTQLLTFIRQDIKSELEAIISYEDVLSKMKSQSIIKTLEDIVGDEKEHVEELTKLMVKYDKHNYGSIDY